MPILIIMIATFLCISVLAYAANLLFLWEIILFSIFAMPIYFYAKRNTFVWCMYMLACTVATGLRFITNVNIVRNIPNIQIPITITNPIVFQYTGLSVILAWVLWLVLIYCYTTHNINIEVKKSATFEELNTNKKIIHNMNLFYVTGSLFIIIDVVIGCVYKLTDLMKNIVLIDVFAFVCCICFSILTNGRIRNRKEEFIEKAREGDISAT